MKKVLTRKPKHLTPLQTQILFGKFHKRDLKQMMELILQKMTALRLEGAALLHRLFTWAGLGLFT